MERLIDSLSASGYDRARASHDARSVRGPRWHSRCFLVAGAASGAGGVFRRRNRIAARVRRRYANLRAQSAGSRSAARRGGGARRAAFATTSPRTTSASRSNRRSRREAQILISEGSLTAEGAEDYAGAFPRCGCARVRGRRFHARWKRSGRNSPPACRNGKRAAPASSSTSQTEGEIERFREIMSEADDALDGVELLEGTLARGFSFPAGNLVVLSARRAFRPLPRRTAGGVCSAPSNSRRQSRADRLQRAQRKAISWSTSSMASAGFSS